jgi:hypothetical protein
MTDAPAVTQAEGLTLYEALRRALVQSEAAIILPGVPVLKGRDRFPIIDPLATWLAGRLPAFSRSLMTSSWTWPTSSMRRSTIWTRFASL